MWQPQTSESGVTQHVLFVSDLCSRKPAQEEGVHGHAGEADGRIEQRGGHVPAEVRLPRAAKLGASTPGSKIASSTVGLKNNNLRDGHLEHHHQ